MGTNRFGFSFNDPINLSDPAGNAAVYKDVDGDGWNEYYGNIAPDEPGYDDDFSVSGISPSEWVDYNNALKSGGNESASVSSGGEWFARLPAELRFGQPVSQWKIANPSFISNYDLLGKILADNKFYSFALERLQAGNYLNYNESWEMAGHIYVSKNGIRYDALPKADDAIRDSTSIAAPSPRKGETSVMFHTHPGSFTIPSNGVPSDLNTAGVFSRTVAGASNLGLIATARGLIWGHNDQGWK